MKRTLLQMIITLTVLLGFEVAQAQTITSGRSASAAAEFRLTDLLARVRASRRARFSFMPASRSVNMNSQAFSIIPLAAVPSLPVTGSGTLGRLTKWAGFTSSNSVIGNSTIFEDKFGMVGIGTDTPTSRLTVMGLIESQGAGGGLKFPDGTIQTTSETGALHAVSHDMTLIGGGTANTPLGVRVPLELNGGFSPFILRVVNEQGGAGVSALGGVNNSDPGGEGVRATGGRSGTSRGGSGVSGVGGLSDTSTGGNGISATGGDSNSGDGGDGVNALGGDCSINFAGDGVRAAGGNSSSGHGGAGVRAVGGVGPLGDGLAGDFNGDVDVSGMLSKAAGSFKIDHPLDPENKYLYHSFVESPDMKNIYDGVATLNSNGEAVIELPEWFQALNRDFRYLLTPIGGPMPGLFVAQKIKENRFRVAGGQPGMEISWLVTGIRRDAFANKNRIKVEEEKPERERGYYLHPDAFDQPEERSIVWARHPEMMQQRRQQREQAERIDGKLKDNQQRQ